VIEFKANHLKDLVGSRSCWN